jgi:tRNA1(Val) A37 N6-methylase TrmN6
MVHAQHSILELLESLKRAHLQPTSLKFVDRDRSGA